MRTAIIIIVIVVYVLLALYMLKVYRNGKLDHADDRLHQLNIKCMNCKITEQNKTKYLSQIDEYRKDSNINQEKLDTVNNNFRLRFKLARHSLK